MCKFTQLNFCVPFMKFKVEVGDLYWEVCGEVRLVFEVLCERVTRFIDSDYKVA